MNRHHRRSLRKVRSPALWAALLAVLCCCPIAAAQEPGRPQPGGVLINDLPEAQEANMMAPVKSPFEEFSARLDRELNFVGRACRLSPEERKSLDAVRDEIIAQFKPLLERQAPAGRAQAGGGVQRMAAVNGQVVVINPAGVAEFLIPDRIIHAQVDLAVNASLPKERLAALEAERKRLEHKLQQAHVLALLAAIDEAMLLSDEQRQRFHAYLEANWRPVWGQLVPGGLISAFGATPLQTAKARGLGGAFDLFDADLEPLLNPVQIAAWREMRTLRLDVPLFAQVADRRAIVLRRIRIAPGAAIAQGGVAPAAVPPAAAPRAVVQVPIQRAQPAAGGRPLAEAELATPAQPPIVDPPKELSLLLDLLVEHVASAAELSPQQRETLLLAGKLDILHYRKQREEQAREAFERADEAPGNQRRRNQTESLAASNPFAAADSRFRKAIASRLSAEQTARRAAVERRRRQMRRETVIQSLAAEFGEAAKLTAAQQDALAAELAAALDEQLPPDADEALETDSQSLALACITNLGRQELRPLVEDDQWDAIERKLVELSRIAIQADAVRRRHKATF